MNVKQPSKKQPWGLQDIATTDPEGNTMESAEPLSQNSADAQSSSNGGINNGTRKSVIAAVLIVVFLAAYIASYFAIGEARQIEMAPNTYIEARLFPAWGRIYQPLGWIESNLRSDFAVGYEQL